MKEFNIRGTCFFEKHYMVDLTSRLEAMKKLIDNETYFCINRGRQYGKTTTINALVDYLRESHSVFSISFEGASESEFKTVENLLSKVLSAMYKRVRYKKVYNISSFSEELLKSSSKLSSVSVENFQEIIEDIILNNSRPIVLIIDEVDQAAQYDSFLNFLGILRAAYLNRNDFPAFQSVILSSVYDIKNLKTKIPDSTGKYNSPWNIAVSFDVPMEFSSVEIAGMLQEYVDEHKIEFDIDYMAQQIANYTGGYPSLVCRLCKKIDEENLGWNRDGLLTAVRKLLKESNTLFDDLCKKIADNPMMKNIFKQILYTGQSYAFDINNEILNLAYSFGFIKDNNSRVKIANPIFEMVLYNLFLSEAETAGKIKSVDRNQFISEGRLDMELILEKFSQHYNDIYDTTESKLLEVDCRRLFMLYVKPIINGTGNYYIEAENRDGTRTDMIIDYHGEQFIIEMKIWHGKEHNQRGEKQLLEYMDKLHAQKGYLLSFCFNQKKTTSRIEKQIDNKTIIEYVV